MGFCACRGNCGVTACKKWQNKGRGDWRAKKKRKLAATPSEALPTPSPATASGVQPESAGAAPPTSAGEASVHAETPATVPPNGLPAQRCCPQRASHDKSPFCEWCACEREGCREARIGWSRGQGRWCSDHVADAPAGPRQYANRNGTFALTASWSLGAQLAAQFQFVFERMPPEDVTAFREFCAFAGVRAGPAPSQVSSAQWSWVALANRAKWPYAVHRLEQHLRARPGLLHESSATDFAEAVVVMIEACNCKPMKAMHQQISGTGHMHSTQGLAMMGKTVGVLLEASPGCRGKVVHLGTAGHPYVIVPPEKMAQARRAGGDGRGREGERHGEQSTREREILPLHLLIGCGVHPLL